MKNYNSNNDNKNENFNLGLEALQIAYGFVDNGRDQEALIYLDKAIKFGVKKAFGERAWCLQALNFNLDSIEDFNEAIALTPEDSNLYFGRGLSKSVIGDLKGAILDGELAVTYSKFENETNEKRNQESLKRGFESATSFYRIQLEMWKQDFNFKNEMVAKFNKFKESGLQKDIDLANELINTQLKVPGENLKRR